MGAKIGLTINRFGTIPGLLARFPQTGRKELTSSLPSANCRSAFIVVTRGFQEDLPVMNIASLFSRDSIFFSIRVLMWISNDQRIFHFDLTGDV